MSYRTLLPAFLLLLASCSGSSGAPVGGDGEISVVVTDTPFDLSLIKRAEVDVVRVRMHAQTANETSSGWITVYDGPPVRVDLAKLRNGIMNEIASGTLPAGTYRQVRVHMSGGELELKNGNVYTTADGTLDLPSAMTSAGYKVFPDPPVVIPAGGREQVLIDFDLSKTYLPVPANDAENASSYKLHPEIRGAVMSVSGEIRVTVSQDDGTGNLVGVPDASVFVLPPGETDTANAVASTVTDATGSGAVLGLAPGTYDVLAEKDASQGRTDGAVVVTGEVTVVDVVLP